MTVISLIVALIVMMLIFKGEKMQALVTNLAMINRCEGTDRKGLKLKLFMNIG